MIRENQNVCQLKIKRGKAKAAISSEGDITGDLDGSRKGGKIVVMIK